MGKFLVTTIKPRNGSSFKREKRKRKLTTISQVTSSKCTYIPVCVCVYTYHHPRIINPETISNYKLLSRPQVLSSFEEFYCRLLESQCMEVWENIFTCSGKESGLIHYLLDYYKLIDFFFFFSLIFQPSQNMGVSNEILKFQEVGPFNKN